MNNKRNKSCKNSLPIQEIYPDHTNFVSGNSRLKSPFVSAIFFWIARSSKALFKTLIEDSIFLNTEQPVSRYFSFYLSKILKMDLKPKSSFLITNPAKFFQSEESVVANDPSISSGLFLVSKSQSRALAVYTYTNLSIRMVSTTKFQTPTFSLTKLKAQTHF